MGRSQEIFTDLDHYRAIIFEAALKRYEFYGKRGPIIGIHGVGGGWHKPVREYFEKNDIGGVLCYFGSLLNGIDSYLPQLDSEVRRYPNSLIVGGSAGGLIALRYTQRFGWNNIGKIITVATPFAGVTRPLALWGKTLDEITPKNQFLKQIISMKPPTGKVLSLFSWEDRYNKNPNGLDLNWPSAILEGNSHGSLQSSWNRISYVLNSELTSSSS